jgi:hypothetical protein
VYGAIKLERKRLEGPLGYQTLIHEASHKYAGTHDYAYFDDTGENPTPTWGLKDKMITNADSYAWFVVRVHTKNYTRNFR